MADPTVAWAPLRYRLHRRDDMTLLAHQSEGTGRIVEVFGDLATATRVAVLVPGNAHRLDTYRTPVGDAPLRIAARRLHHGMTAAAPFVASAVVAWLGYRCPVGVPAAATPGAARAARDDLAALTHWLPPGATVCLVGHSYGSVVCGLAAPYARVDDLVGVGSPGFGVGRVADLDTTARVWAGRAARDWIRLFPRGRLGGLGHGRQPTTGRFGARVFRTTGARGHSGYWTPGSESLANLARIGLGRHHQVTLVRPPVADRAAAAVHAAADPDAGFRGHPVPDGRGPRGHPAGDRWLATLAVRPPRGGKQSRKETP